MRASRVAGGSSGLPRVRLRAAPRDHGNMPVVLPWVAGRSPPPALATAVAAAGFDPRSTDPVTLALPSGPHVLVGIAPAGDAAACPTPAAALTRRPGWQRVTGSPAPSIAAAERAGGLATAAALPARRLTIDARGLPAAIGIGLATGACLRAWQFDRLRAVSDQALEAIDLLLDDPEAAAPLWDAAAAGIRGALFARELVAEPANRLTPAGFAARLEALGDYGIAVDVLGRKRLERAGFGALLAVGRAAGHAPRLAVLRWRGSFAAPPVVFIGKGICFDAGGLAIKPAAGMEAMRGDMAGAAACAGAILALALRRSPAPAVAVLALAENLPGDAAYRPGDVLRTRSGRTVEVVDPDAEGRLVLADALHHAVSCLKPRAVIDLGTLTGAAVVALGAARAALFGNDAALLAQVAAAGAAVGEPVWPLPIGARHREDLRSDIADLKQCASGRGQPDACHAAAFLEAFVPAGLPWAHLDIAGVAQAAEATPLAAKGPTGFGARLLDALMAARFEAPDA